MTQCCEYRISQNFMFMRLYIFIPPGWPAAYFNIHRPTFGTARTGDGGGAGAGEFQTTEMQQHRVAEARWESLDQIQQVTHTRLEDAFASLEDVGRCSNKCLHWTVNSEDWNLEMTEPLRLRTWKHRHTRGYNTVGIPEHPEFFGRRLPMRAKS